MGNSRARSASTDDAELVAADVEILALHGDVGIEGELEAAGIEACRRIVGDDGRTRIKQGRKRASMQLARRLAPAS